MKTAVTIALGAALALVVGADDAHAEPAPPASTNIAATCAASYQARLADARKAITTQGAYMKEWSKGMPWFDENCRFLTALERAVRKEDDPAAFVCRKSKGRPAILTTRYVADHPAPADVIDFQEHFHRNDVCRAHDVAAGRPSLALREPTAEHLLEVLCFEVESASCTNARAQIAAKRAVKKGD